MGFRVMLVVVAMLATVSGVLADQGDILIENAGIARTLNAFGGPLRTTKIEVSGTSVLKQPSVEFQIDLDYKGEPVSLVPSDFDLKGAETVKSRGEMQTSLRMQSHHDILPILIHVHYYRDPLGTYQQKSIVISPFKAAPGAVIRRVVIEDMVLSPDLEPVSPDSGSQFAYGTYSRRAAFSRKAGKGLFFFTASLMGREGYAQGQGLTMWEDVFVPLDKGYETGRATIGTASGSPEVVFTRLREFLWEDYCSMKGKREVPTDAPLTAVRRADVAEDKIKGATGVLTVDFDEWKLAGALKPGWSKQADYQSAIELTAACDKLRKANPEAVIRLIASNAKEVDLVHCLGLVDQVERPAGDAADPAAAARVTYLESLVFPPPTLVLPKSP